MCISRTVGIPFDDIRKGLSNYTAADYENESTYLAILQDDRSEIRMQQYLNLLRKDALCKGVNPAVVDKCIQSSLDNKHKSHIYLTVDDALREIITAESYKGKTVLCPFMCGSGKSTAISHLIKNTILNVESGKCMNGLIVITDLIERMDKYLAPTDVELKQFLSEHSEKISIITSSNVHSEMQRLRHCPVVLLTTQRYLSYSLNDIKRYLDIWDGGKRTVAIIDELLPLYEQATLSRQDAWNILGVLDDVLVAPEELDDKIWCVRQWKKYAERFSDLIAEHERSFSSEQNSECYSYCRDSELKLTESDAKFDQFIAKHGSSLNTDIGFNIQKKIATFRRFAECGGLFVYSRRDKSHYVCNVTVCIDNIELVTTVNQQVVIMDGTGSIHPNYDNQALSKYPSSDFDRRLDNLTIKFVDLDTSKKAHKRRAREIHNIVMANLQDNSVVPKEAVLFTYKERETLYKSEFQVTDHFGAIRGKNYYQNNKCIVQVGLNIYGDKDYLVSALLRSRDTYERVKSAKSNAEANKLIHEFIQQEQDLIKDITYRTILSDMEQNIFRSAIRDPKCTDDVTYYIYCDTKQYKSVIDLAREHFGAYGATVEKSNLEQHQTSRVHKESLEKKFLIFYESMTVGQQYTRKDIEEKVPCTSQQLRDLKQRSSKVKGIMERDVVVGEKKGKHFIKH